MGTQSRAATLRAVLEFERSLKELCEVDFEIVFVHEYDLGFCKGCKLCFDYGEDKCPLYDDRDRLIEFLDRADGVVFAAPSYAYQVPALLKNFFDRLAFTFHRPRFFNKVCTAILTRGVPVGGRIRGYMESSGANMGFTSVRGCSLWTRSPMSEDQEKQFTKRLSSAAHRFSRALQAPVPHKPSLFRLMLFRTSRSGIRASSYTGYDRVYFQEKGWFESDYYYPIELNFFQKASGRFFDRLGRMIGTDL